MSENLCAGALFTDVWAAVGATKVAGVSFMPPFAGGEREGNSEIVGISRSAHKWRKRSETLM